ncbi:MAG: pilus assembly protein PilM [Oligosphaeraceae bacterium]|nr:pilus assembly protein PilM [Oligosphaeraceae bacterium]
MAKNERILAIDIGATSIKLCEFEYGDDGSIGLAVFAYREYEEELSEDTRMGVVAGLLRQMLSESGCRARRALVSISGQSVLMRFGKIPYGNYDRKQIKQLAEFEARRNIPFAIEEVIWDYQLIVGEDSESVDIMSVVVKDSIVSQFTNSVSSIGLEPILVDVAPVCCYNAARANGLGKDESVALLNIGGRSTNLIFLQGERFFARTIPIAGYSITQQIAKEFSIGLPEAEELKRHHGFVSLGGAYAEPSSETAASVSKIIRNVMARLHGEISRSISIYKAQQKGAAPTRLYLTGGSSILTYCDTFFAEKLDIPVEYFNPFPVINILPGVDRQRLGEVAHMFSETIGLGLRFTVSCPIEISLLPQEIRRQQALTAKKPYFIAAMLAVLILLGTMLIALQTRAASIQDHAGRLQSVRNQYQPNLQKIKSMDSEAKGKEDQCKQLADLLMQRTIWPMLLNEIYRLKPDDLWLTAIEPIYGEVQPFEASSVGPVVATAGEDSLFGPRGGEDMMFGGGGGGLFGEPGGGGLFGGPGGEAAVAVGQVVSIGGLNLEGAFVVPTPGQTAVTDSPEADYPFAVPDAVAADVTEEGAMAPRPLSGNSPEIVFVERLRSSRLFSSESNMTTLKVFRQHPDFKNAGTFTLQIKFEFPLEYTQYSGK